MSQNFGARDDGGINLTCGTTLRCMMIAGLILATLTVASPGTVMRI